MLSIFIILFSLLFSFIYASDTLLILTGQLRSFQFTKKSFERHILDILNLDIVFCISPLQTLISGKTPNINLDESLEILKTWPSNNYNNKVILKEVIPFFNSSNISNKIKSLNTNNVVQQMYVWQTCWNFVKKYEETHNITYKYYIKHRFDEALWGNYPSITEISNLITHNSILLASYLDFCDGVNDRLWIGDKDAVNTAFNTLSYFSRSSNLENCPEFYLHQNLKSHKTRIYRREFYANVMETYTGCPRHICLDCNIHNNQYQLLIQRGYNPYIYNITQCI